MSFHSMSRRRALARVCSHWVDSLEPRRLLHGGHDHSLADGLVNDDRPNLPAFSKSLSDSSGHIAKAQNDVLAPEVQWLIDPHEVEDASSEPMDFDKLLGKPGQSVGGEAIVYPDFFPALDSAITVDQTSQPGRTLLRFGTQVNNQGNGPAILISGRPGIDPIPSGAPITSWVNANGGQNVLQAVYDFNGSTFSLSQYRAAGTFTYHAGHGHFHFNGYAEYRLRNRNSDGTPGDYVMRPDGTTVVGTKTGFCLINTSASFIMENGQSSTTLPGYRSTSPYNGQPATGCNFLQGVRVGQADEYVSNLEGQWIDVTGVPNGQYYVEISLDGENAIMESNENNNANSWAYTLNVNNPTDGVAPDVYDTGTNNNSLANARDFGELGVYTETGLSVHTGSDFDYFRFTAASSGLYTVSSVAAGLYRELNIYLLDSNGNQLAASTNSGVANESISYNFVDGQTYFLRAQSYNSTLVSNYQLSWAIKPQVSTALPDSSAAEEGPARGSFVIARNGPTTSPLTVNFVLGGTAVNGVDYETVAGSVTLGDLQSEAVIEIVPLVDNLVEANETVTLTITSNNAYVIGSTTSQSVTIADVPPRITGSGFTFSQLPLSVDFDFSLDVGASLSPTDLRVTDLINNITVPVAGVTYDAGLRKARFGLNGVLPDGRYSATLLSERVTHAEGAPLAEAGVVSFFMLAGDANRDEAVDLDDFTALAAGFGQPGILAQGNFDYIGNVDLDDFTLLAAQFGKTLPAARQISHPPVGNAPAPLFADRPLRSILDELSI